MTQESLNIIIGGCIGFLSAGLISIINSFFQAKESDKNRKWEKQRYHRDFQIEIKRNRKEQIEIFIRKFSILFYETVADVLYLQIIKNQNELDDYYAKILSVDRNDPDQEVLAITYEGVVRSIEDEKLIQLLDQIKGLFFEMGDYWRQFFVNKPKFEFVSSEIWNSDARRKEISSQYKNLLVEFFRLLDVIYRNSDPFINE